VAEVSDQTGLIPRQESHNEPLSGERVIFVWLGRPLNSSH
jgi:hypothetical protein